MDSGSRIRLPYLDGLRGFAALYVVLTHLYGAVRFWSNGAGLPPLVQKALMAFHFGNYMVDVFIVLSGYVLALPVIRASLTLPGGTLAYLGRRAKRILPPFYAALFLAYLIHFATADAPLVRDGVRVDLRALLAHLLVVNNLQGDWKIPFNAPLWSVATEWQLYFLLPALLLPLWRKAGIGVAVAAAFAIGIGADIATGGRIASARPWYLGLFATGMLAAEIGFGNLERWSRWRAWNGWPVLTAVSLVLLAGVTLREAAATGPEAWIADTLAGIAAATFLVRASHRVATGQSPDWAAQVLVSRPFQYLGRISYSVYLVHWPLLYGIYPYLATAGLPPFVFLAALFGLVFPLLVGACALFSELVEQPLLGQGRLIRGPLSRSANRTA